MILDVPRDDREQNGRMPAYQPPATLSAYVDIEEVAGSVWWWPVTWMIRVNLPGYTVGPPPVGCRYQYELGMCLLRRHWLLWVATRSSIHVICTWFGYSSTNLSPEPQCPKPRTSHRAVVSTRYSQCSPIASVAGSSHTFETRRLRPPPSMPSPHTDPLPASRPRTRPQATTRRSAASLVND